jgi:acetate kinase
MFAELKEATPYDLEHLPLEMALIDACIEHYRDFAQVACFDSVFHHSMPRVARQLPLPRHYEAQCYGYHDLACEFLMQELRRLGDPAAKLLGGYSAALGGLCTLVFAGGFGENSPQIRERICSNLGFYGITLNPARNSQTDPIISSDSAVVTVRVITTNEDLVMVNSVIRVLKLDVIQ